MFRFGLGFQVSSTACDANAPLNPPPKQITTDRTRMQKHRARRKVTRKSTIMCKLLLDNSRADGCCNKQTRTTVSNANAISQPKVDLALGRHCRLMRQDRSEE